MTPAPSEREQILSQLPEATEQQLDDWLRWLLTGDDGSCEGNLDRTTEAVRGWYNPFSQDELLEMLNMCSSKYTTTSRTLWENRDGKSWQQSIEARVAAYREPAPSKHWDDVMEDCRQVAVEFCVGSYQDCYIVTCERTKEGEIDFSHEKDVDFPGLQLTVKRLAVMALLGGE